MEVLVIVDELAGASANPPVQVYAIEKSGGFSNPEGKGVLCTTDEVVPDEKTHFRAYCNTEAIGLSFVKDRAFPLCSLEIYDGNRLEIDTTRIKFGDWYTNVVTTTNSQQPTLNLDTVFSDVFSEIVPAIQGTDDNYLFMD